ncbi:MAG: AraC family transcriptional regulator [Salinisphaeraceae bacterium]|nr:AraC family transcriptional regulator [Salinisphaeraceae bacterium]
MKRKDWKGDIVFSHSMAIFRGHVGDNKLHSHWASQLTISLDDQLRFETEAGAQSAKAVYFPSKTPHRLETGFICSIYFDPLADVIPNALNRKAVDGWAALSIDELPQELTAINAHTDLRALMHSDLLSPTDATAAESRFERVIEAIQSQLAGGHDIDRDSLAEIAHLSPTRFSHWFVERSGVPLRSYKKWLKLRIVVDAVLEGKNPMEAAMLAGFSDLAHMSRAFAESFGFTYMDAVRAWQNLSEK